MSLPTPGKPPQPNDHLKKADQNKAFGTATITISSHPTSAGWALTAFFYAALHYTEAYLMKQSARLDNHQERIDAIKADPKLRRIYPQYRHLMDYSFNARYTLQVYGKPDVEKARPSLEAVEKHIRALLS
jgi:hypothetical protein